jgi:hypothetical protein
LYIPAICFPEARETTRRRFTPRSRSEDLREFVKWARDENQLTENSADVAFRVFETFNNSVENELRRIPDRLNELARNSFLRVFPLSELMLDRQVSIGTLEIFLKPFDLAILAAVLVKAEELGREGHSWVGFCELDSDLQPWDKRGNPDPILSDLYKNSCIWVYGDFLADDVEDLPDGWIEPTV